MFILTCATAAFAGTIGPLKGVPQASLTLQNSNMALANCNYADWTLEKTTSTPEITESGTAQWTVTATKVSISDSKIHVFGYVTIYNGGSGSATIGNILVNLQTNKKVSGKYRWVSASVDVADAFKGDAATTVNILASASQEVPAYAPTIYAISGAKGVFRENTASGKLEFTDADSNTVWAITPQKSIPALSSVNMRFEAEFNNTIMNIPAGASVRAEVIVTFGNAGGRGDSGASGAKIDINGNGLIDADEAYIRSVPSRITMTVPTLITCNDEVTLSDPEPVVTGTVEKSNFINGVIGEGLAIGAGDPAGTSYSYPVTVDVSAGAEGGSVFNTAYLEGEDVYVQLQIGKTPVYDEFGILTGYDPIYYPELCCEGIQLEASSEVVVKARDTGSSDDNELQPGDFNTFDQGGWDNSSPNQGYQILLDHWATIYPSGLAVGGYFKMTFSSAAKVRAYLPASGNEDVLTANVTNPTSTSANKFGGHVLALRLNVDCSAAGITPVGFGNLLLANLAEGSNIGLQLTVDQATALNGKSISDVLADAEHVLGGNGATSTYGLDVSQLNLLAERLNDSCKFGNVSSFAGLYLRKP